MDRVFKVGDRVYSKQWLLRGTISAMLRCPHKNCTEISILLDNDKSSRYHLSSFQLVED